MRWLALFIQSVMVNNGIWRKGIYDSVECDDPNVFYTLLGQHFHRRDVATTIHAFSAVTLVVKYPLDLLRATAQVCFIFVWIFKQLVFYFRFIITLFDSYHCIAFF